MFEIEKKAVEYCEQYGIDEGDPRRADILNAFCVGAQIHPAPAVPNAPLSFTCPNCGRDTWVKE